MKPNTSMTEEDWRWFELGKDARKLQFREVEILEEQLSTNPSNMDLRIQLLSFYETESNKLKHKNAEHKLYEHYLWLIENKPAGDGYLKKILSASGRHFKSKPFATLRQAWLEQVFANPSDGTIIGNAALFIAWNDIETASELVERAYALQPSAGWLRRFVIHLDREVRNSPSLYKNRVRKLLIRAGIRSLNTEPGGAPFLTCEYVSDAALSMERFDIVLWCAEILSNWGTISCDQMAIAYRGLVALRKNDVNFAIQLLQKLDQPQPITFRLATELFESGERESIIDLIKRFKRRIYKSAKTRWLKQIDNDEPPDFADYCC